MIAAEEIVLPAQGQRPDCILHAVVVDVVSAIKGVDDRMAKRTAREKTRMELTRSL